MTAGCCGDLCSSAFQFEFTLASIRHGHAETCDRETLHPAKNVRRRLA